MRSVIIPSRGSIIALKAREKQGGSPNEGDPPDRLALCEHGGQLLRHFPLSVIHVNKSESGIYKAPAPAVTADMTGS